jgi:CHASE2 domain-containing sensor protein
VYVYIYTNVPCKVKVQQVLTVGHTTAGVYLHAHLIDTAVLKQCNVWVKQQFTNYMKPFSCYTTSIYTRLPYELKPIVIVLLIVVLIVVCVQCSRISDCINSMCTCKHNSTNGSMCTVYMHTQ